MSVKVLTLSKQRRKIPEVKQLHLKSEDVSKSEWIQKKTSVLYSVCSYEMEKSLFPSQIVFKLLEGIEALATEAQGSLVEKMAVVRNIFV